MPPSPDLARRPRTRIAFSDADMVRLRDLYCDLAVPMVKVAQAFGVSASTLYHWIAEMDWPRRSAQAPRLDARVDLFARVQADRQTGAKRRRKPKPVSRSALERDVMARAREELDALAADPGPDTFEERRRRAALIDQISRAIARMERIERRREADFDGMTRGIEQLARAMRADRPKPARREKPPSWGVYGEGGKPERRW